MAVSGGEATLRTRTGLDWTARFPGIARAGAGLPPCVMDGEAVAFDAEGRPDFAALQAALSGGPGRPVVYFAFDLLREGREDLRRLPQSERKARLRRLLRGRPADIIRYVEDFGAPGEAVLRSAAARHGRRRLQRATAPMWRPQRQLGEEQMPRGGGGGDRRLEPGSPWQGIGALLAGARRDGRLVYLGARHRFGARGRASC